MEVMQSGESNNLATHTAYCADFEMSRQRHAIAHYASELCGENNGIIPWFTTYQTKRGSKKHPTSFFRLWEQC